jgi:ferredoxin
MTVRVDVEKCTGIGMCEATAPNAFSVGDDGASHVLIPEPEGDELLAAQEAVTNCPTGAISID